MSLVSTPNLGEFRNVCTQEPADILTLLACLLRLLGWIADSEFQHEGRVVAPVADSLRNLITERLLVARTASKEKSSESSHDDKATVSRHRSVPTSSKVPRLRSDFRLSSAGKSPEAAISIQSGSEMLTHPQAEVIESLPGMGPTLAAEFVVAAGDLSAYTDAGHLASAAGLVPVAARLRPRHRLTCTDRQALQPPPAAGVLHVRADQHHPRGPEPVLLHQESRRGAYTSWPSSPCLVGGSASSGGCFATTGSSPPPRRSPKRLDFVIEISASQHEGDGSTAQSVWRTVGDAGPESTTKVIRRPPHQRRRHQPRRSARHRPTAFPTGRPARRSSEVRGRAPDPGPAYLAGQRSDRLQIIRRTGPQPPNPGGIPHVALRSTRGSQVATGEGEQTDAL